MRPSFLVRLAPGAAAMLAVVAVLAALFPDYVYHWDEVQLTLGLEQFDPRSHHPHPPGYYLFVVLGRLLRPFVVLPESALRAAAALAGAGFVGLVAGGLPARLKLSHRFAWVLVAALFVVFSPIVLFHSLSALPYTAEAFGWLAILLAVGARPRGHRLVLLAVGIGLAGGVRQTLILWGVLIVGLAWLLDRSWLDARGALRFLAGLIGGVLLWSVPMLVEAGGWGEYAAVSGPMLQGNIWEKSIFHEGGGALVRRLTRMPFDLWLAAGPWLVAAVAALVMRFRAEQRERLARRDLLPIGAGLSFLFYLFLIYDSAGYILAVAFPLAAYAMLALAEAPAKLQALTVPLLALSLLVLPGGVLRGGESGYAAHRAHDRLVESRVDAIADNFDPQTTVLVTSHEYWQWSFRHVMYYLPEFTTIQLLPDRFFVDAGPDTPYLTAKAHTIRFSGPDGFDIRRLGPSVRQVLYVVPHDVERFVAASCAPFMQPFEVTAEEPLPVIDLSQADVAVARSQLHCRAR